MGNADERYANEVGEGRGQPPDDHPDRWQRDYAGRPAEREGLLDRLREAAEHSLGRELQPDPDPPTQQESLW